MKRFLQRHVAFPAFATALYFICMRNQIGFFQSNSELPSYLAIMAFCYMLYCFAAAAMAFAVGKLFKFRPALRGKIFWSIAAAPLSFALLLELAAALICHHGTPTHPLMSEYKDAVERTRCRLAEPVRSPASLAKETKILFSNRSNFKVKIHWVDYKGKLREYMDLLPGQKYEQPSRIGQYWSVTDMSGKCLGVYEATRTMKQTLVMNGY